MTKPRLLPPRTRYQGASTAAWATLAVLAFAMWALTVWLL